MSRVSARSALDTLDTLAARAEGAVVVLPGVALPDPAPPVTPASRVSWHPTWSEWANDDAPDPDPDPASDAHADADAVMAAAPVPATV